MSSLIPGYEYDIFISYRQKDNKGDRWVSEFVEALKTELESTFKEEISVYFDINPHDGLLETHDVDASLKEKLKCLVFIPIISRTYCDPKSFAWEHEFKAFVDQASEDQFGLKIKLPNGNVASRILPVRIHDLDNVDIKLCESLTGGFLRGVEFIYQEPGVNRPLRGNEDRPNDNLNRTFYRNQINKVANAVKEIITGLKTGPVAVAEENVRSRDSRKEVRKEISREVNEKPVKSGRIKILSGFLITAIVVMAVILVYPKIFKHDKFEKLRSSDRSISIAVMPFNNLTGDPNLDFWQRGLSELLINDLGTSSDISVLSSQSIDEVIESMGQIQTASIIPSVAKEAAMKVNAKSHIIGNYQKSRNKIRIMINLVETQSGEVLWTGKIDGTLESDFIDLTDSLSSQVKNYLEIKALEKEANSDYYEAFPSSAKAYRYYIDGLNMILKKEYRQAVNH